MTTILYDAPRTVKTRRPFGAGILPTYEDDRTHYGSLGLPMPLPAALPVHKASTKEQAYELAFQAVAGNRASWISSAPASWKAIARRRENDRLDRLAGESAALDLMEAGISCC